MPNAPPARSPTSPKYCRNCSACSARFHKQDLMMTTSPLISMNSVMNLRAALMSLSKAGLTHEMVRHSSMQGWLPRLAGDFITLAHRHQEPPAVANGGGPWTTWLVLGGRGAGKTRLGAEWVRAIANGTEPLGDQRCFNIALVGES